MKNGFIVIVMVLSLINAKDMYKIDAQNILIKGNKESCSVSVNRRGSFMDTDCTVLTNSKNIRIFCTKRKKMCKTFDEVRKFTTKEENSPFSYQACLDNARTTLESRICNAKALKYWDGLLNHYYKQAMHRLSNQEKKSLRKAQRSWITYRDNRCEADASAMRGGTGEALLYGGCMIDMTKNRAKELERY